MLDLAPELLCVWGMDLLEDLASRWARARKAAALAIVGPVKDGASEQELMGCAAEVDQVELHRRLFENGVRLGEGFRRFHRRDIALKDVPEILQATKVQCLSGTWQDADQGRAFRLERAPCNQACTSAQCDGWREATDGLVAGLTGSAKHTRVASWGRGQKTCIDILYENPESSLRWGEIPAEDVPTLESVAKFVKLFKGADVEFLGVSEGVLLYRLETSGCGDLRGNAQQMIEETLKRKLPHLEVRELSPRSPFDSEMPETHSPHRESP